MANMNSKRVAVFTDKNVSHQWKFSGVHFKGYLHNSW